MSPAGGVLFSPESFMAAVRDIRATYRVPESATVWAIRSGFEDSLSVSVKRRFPNVAVDVEVSRATGDWLFAADGPSLAKTDME
jgi:hypothetical protein